MRAAPSHPRRERGGSLSRPCGASRPQAWRPRISLRRSAVRSNGRRRDLFPRKTPGAAARRREIEENKAVKGREFAPIENGKEAFLRMRDKIGDRHLARQNKSNRAGV